MSYVACLHRGQGRILIFLVGGTRSGNAAQLQKSGRLLHLESGRGLLLTILSSGDRVQIEYKPASLFGISMVRIRSISGMSVKYIYAWFLERSRQFMLVKSFVVFLRRNTATRLSPIFGLRPPQSGKLRLNT